MRFSRATLKPALLLLALAACASEEPAAERPAEKATPKVLTPAGTALLKKVLPSLSELEARELKNPGNARLKFLLGWRHWCEGRRGVAYEHWLWIDQYAKDYPRRAALQKLLRLAQRDPHQVSVELSCDKVRQAEQPEGSSAEEIE